MKKLSLLVMAAGMGSRFGGLKQIEPVWENGEFIIDYSIFDAIKTGFNKLVFVIKKENYEIFRETIGKRVEEKIETHYVFQEGFIDYEGKHFERNKPYGTSFAIYSAKDIIDENFLVINSDDFYGRDAFIKAYQFLSNNDDLKEMGIVSYEVNNTLTKYGSVKRGVCVSENSYLKTIVESKIEKIDNKIIASPLDNSPSFELNEDDIVSMNVLLFTPYIFTLIEKYLGEFIKELELNEESAEYLIPDVINKANINGDIKVKVISTTAEWFGMTYKEDKEDLVKSISKLVESGVYNNNLWEE